MPIQDIAVPDLGDVNDVEVIEVLVAVGDELAAEDPVITLESAKASMDVPCPVAGKLTAIHIKVGDKVNSGDPMLSIEAEASTEPAAQTETKAKTETESATKPKATDAESRTKTKAAETEAEPESEPEAEPEAEPANTAAPAESAPVPSQKKDTGPIYASPAVRRIATEHNVDLSTVTGTGPHERITKADIQNHLGGDADSAEATVTANNKPSSQGSISSEPMSRINKLSAAHLHKSWNDIPHVTHFDDADITALEDWRVALKQKRSEPRLSLLPFIMKAVVNGLQQQPKFNCQISADGEQLEYRHYFNLGIAVDTPNGLVVPVIKDVDQKGVWQLAAELAEVAQRARDGKLKAADLQDGCFTISNLGGVGGQHFTPIINAPEVAILGLGQARWQLCRQGAPRSDAPIEDRLIQPLAVSYDHRVIDGAVAARFIAALKANLEDIRHLLL